MKKLLTLAECAKTLGIHEQTVYTLIKERKIAFTRIRYRYYFLESDIDRFIQKNRVKEIR